MDYNPFDYFDHIFCINLDERTDRWDECQIEFDKVGIKDRVERFSAIKDGHGRKGCGQSHISVLKLCKERGYKTPLILEDDVMFLDDTLDNLKKSLSEFKEYENWSMFYLGGTLNKKPWQKLDNLIITDFMACLTAYSVNPLLYDYIIENIRGNKH